MSIKELLRLCCYYYTGAARSDSRSKGSALLLYCFSALLCYCAARSDSWSKGYCFTALLLYCATAPRARIVGAKALLYCFTALLLYCATVLLRGALG